MNKKRVKLSTWLIAVGSLAILTAGGLFAYNTYSEKEAAEFSVAQAEVLLSYIEEKEEKPEEQFIEDAVTGAVKKEWVYTINGTAYIGVLSIPGLRLSLPVNSEWSYPALKRTPCRFSGDIESDTLVIAAHNYRQHFANISRLVPGESVKFTDADGAVHLYKVMLIEIVEPERTREVMYSGYDLTLFTCTYGGTARVVVRCARV